MAALVYQMHPDADIADGLNTVLRVATDTSTQFTIRHHEVGKIEITDDRDLVDFRFHMYFNVVRFALVSLAT